MGNVLGVIARSDFPQLGSNEVYADWTGSALPPVHLLDAIHDQLRSTLIGNPHSHHAPSARAMQDIVETRDAILDYFNADPKDYEVIFTSGATSAIRLMEHFKLEGGEMLLTADNHNSVNGLRETAKRSGAVVRYSPITRDLQLDEEHLNRMLRFPRSTGHKLFIYPAKSNYTGICHSLEWVKKARDLGWHVMLDAAAFSANDRLDLSQVRPDFVPVSFYKLFGYPTGLGCLIIRKDAYSVLHKKWFTGGSILLVSVMKDFFAPESLGYARFEDGSVNFANIPFIKNGLRFMESLHGVKKNVLVVAKELRDALLRLNVNGNTVVVHSPEGTDTVTFSIKRGEQIEDAWLFEQAATKVGIYVRTGCFCNPGVNEKVFGYSVDAFEALYNDAIDPNSITIEKLREYTGDAPIGAIRASFGYVSSTDDARRIAEFVEDYMSLM